MKETITEIVWIDNIEQMKTAIKCVEMELWDITYKEDEKNNGRWTKFEITSYPYALYRLGFYYGQMHNQDI